MRLLTSEQIDALMERSLPKEVWQPYRAGGMPAKLARYLELLLRWNGVVHLTAVRSAEEVVRRHFAESVFAGMCVPACEDLLDLGSGAGFPGVPIQLLRPELEITLAEANGKKAAFLREVVRELGLRSRVFAGRAESLAAGAYGCVCLRAVDPMEVALREAGRLARAHVMVLGSVTKEAEYVGWLPGWHLERREDSAGLSGVFCFRR